jgi:hypothetical protein
VTYPITFAGYGGHWHGHESGSVDREHNLPGSRLIEADPNRVSAESQRMDQPPYGLDRCRREAVLAAHVHTNHVHIVVEAEARPERVMNDLQSYASRCLNRLGLDDPARKRWARHECVGGNSVCRGRAG